MGRGSSRRFDFSFSQRKKYLLAHHGLDLCLEHCLEWGWRREIDLKTEIERGRGGQRDPGESEKEEEGGGEGEEEGRERAKGADGRDASSHLVYTKTLLRSQPSVVQFPPQSSFAQVPNCTTATRPPAPLTSGGAPSSDRNSNMVSRLHRSRDHQSKLPSDGQTWPSA